jgi:hypothetical protein
LHFLFTSMPVLELLGIGIPREVIFLALIHPSVI